ncbi:hypothetical protein ACFP1I_09325 [Dyadobacter subterraneus]|uniref:MFS transporter n=1 Tax=Dyadobacter subterraneus TaxID=2773304 RepID=A0ABR9WB45_9BACT|nr:hypothetical protein [Dyadobacter subterraneus]MBE9462698.1 hypothetical protein [Dyadobacter subterraneus]
MMKNGKCVSLRGLDLINFTLADVRDGISPFLGIYLLSSQHWNLKDITALELGASLSNVARGYIASMFSFRYAFLFLSLIAALAFVICLLFMKETYETDPK